MLTPEKAKVLQLLGDFVPQTSYWDSASGPPVSQPHILCSSTKFCLKS